MNSVVHVYCPFIKTKITIYEQNRRLCSLCLILPDLVPRSSCEKTMPVPTIDRPYTWFPLRVVIRSTTTRLIPRGLLLDLVGLAWPKGKGTSVKGIIECRRSGAGVKATNGKLQKSARDRDCRNKEVRQ